MHDPVEKYTSGRTHDGTSQMWIHPSVVDNSFEASCLLMDPCCASTDRTVDKLDGQ